jgi:hypothetical protein
MAQFGDSQEEVAVFSPESPFLDTPSAPLNEFSAGTAYENALWELNTPFQHDS